ncbi:hypothetical protein KXV22_001434 [Aspergillus fumigatus]|nr:hypothetical protein KXV65_007476 [Aspergillus fumigatus]KAH2852332.1 hypothetical protein KXW36_004689 [Aspergillus fumigatus]KAH3080589.1 hypothetical protein KXW28_003617 [Aspergillus fumigatus]KAH3286182.1 hypothetical protein KXV19_003699 [Aspergillus fumigatus]KAH3573404.1 hypothetical protein KXV22_001434 [Aspergillus fumigatus]
MDALRRLLVHAPPESCYLQLKSSVFGDFCLHSLRSSIRELRIVTGRLVISFVRKDINADTRRSNFVVILEWLRSLSEKQELPLHETCILTLCHIAEVSDDEEMNIILLRLLEYLGHPNPFICAVAYAELSKLAQRLSVTPAGLFRPFWRTLSITVVKNFQSRPHMAEQLCDLLGMNVDDFLRLTEVHILPYLVLTRKRDVITRVGAAYKHIKTPFDICSEKNNLAAILAFLMSQPWSDPEGMIMSVLSDIDSAFGGRTLAELALVIREVRKAHGHFHRALHLLAALVPRKSTATSKKANLLCHFIEEHVLGIITQFAHAINDFQIRQPLIEKRRNILAIGEMIKVARGHISSALPQICACLRSALSIEELSDHAFSAWSVLVSSLHEEELEPLIDQTFSIVIRYWDAFNYQSKKTAEELIGYILRSHSGLVHTNFSTIPSLASIPALSALESEISKMKEKMDVRSQLSAFGRRCQSENAAVVEQALRELLPCLSRHEEFLHESVLSEQPDPVVAQLTRSLLDCCVKFNAGSDSITLLSAQCLGLVGCLDPNRVDPVKDKKDILVLSNFDRMEETFDFVLFFLQHVLVQAFLSASNTRAQGFLAYAMQNLLRLCNLDSAVTQRSRDVQADEKYRRWSELPETVRNTLTPFLTSKYTVTVGAIRSRCKFPIFSTELTHGDWLRSFVQDLLQRGSGDNAQLIFSVCSRIVKGQDISIASFLLPFAVLNRIVGGTQEERLDLQSELTTILSHPLPEASNRVHEAIILCSQSVFEILDYLSRWLQGKKKLLHGLKNHASHTGRSHKDSHQDSLSETYSSQVKAVETFLGSIPPEVISKRAVECKSFSRALFHWEQYIRRFKSQSDKNDHTSTELLYQHLQVIYSQIDEPDGIEGISSHLHVLNIDQQVLQHRKAGRWVTAQSWYELQVEKEPDNIDAQWNLLTCLRESGQQDAIIARVDTLNSAGSTSRFLPFAVEASWITGNWDKLRSYLQMRSPENTGDFNIGVGSALCALRLGNKTEFRNIIHDLQLSVAKSLTVNSVTSLQSCHDSILKLHALTEMELISDCEGTENSSLTSIHDVLNRRLDVLGGYIADKQYLLGLRRATMELTHGFMESDIAGSWLTSARLSRKGNYTNQAYHSMLRAARLKDRSATIEHARLLWKDGHHRKAIQTLEGAIAANEFASDTSSSGGLKNEKQQNLIAARAHLLLAKWTDRAGQTQSDVIVQRWEKAHYYLGKHYDKILESEKAKPLGKEAQIYLPASHETEYLKGFRAFPRDPTTIDAVLDDAQVLSSLQKPRKISIRGSDGKIYNVLCKPKDDLRKDQRLMEFNNTINRFLKKDVESSKRRMYIKTYAVTPLNEECGLIEWVDNLRTLREIIIKLLKERGIMPNYNEIRHYLNEACSEASKLHLFTTKVLMKFPPVLHEWFVEMFPETGAWFAARLRYTRSCAVMSMVGYVLGLGDRHGENILFEEGTGGVIHVDFNCLFDKGLTFEKPELVPFRLTQNMIDAFGAYGYNGPFRRTCEISLRLLRQNEDALMTVLETFLHDPTTDFIGKKRRTHANVPETPAGVLENVRNKLRGLLPGESVPLSVDGHVDELITQATDKRNLAAMYIGWCAFF